MGTFFIYILKSAVCLALFYLFYKLLMSRETFHRFNRFALLGLLVLSTLVPYGEMLLRTLEPLPDAGAVLVEMEQPTLDFQALTVEDDTSEAEYLARILLAVYLLGVLFTLSKNIYAFGQLVHITRSGKKEDFRKYFPTDEQQLSLVRTRAQLFRTEKPVAPFSWMGSIVISGTDLEENGKEILCHELAHIRKRHSVDLLIADLCICLQWFNPAAWLLKAELQNIHEFEADETVIRTGINMKNYQLLLIKKAVGSRLYSIANSFNHSKLKKRITMMMKKKSNPWARLKYLYVFPVTAVALTAFARPEISVFSDEISSVKVSDFPLITKTESPDLTQPPTKGKVRIEGYVVEHPSGKPIEGASILIRNTTNGTISDKNGHFTLEAPAGAVATVSFIGLQTHSFVVEANNGASTMNIKLRMREETTQTNEIVVVGYEQSDEAPAPAQSPVSQPAPADDEDMVFMVVEEMPEFPGGMQELMNFMARNIKYPADALKAKIEGRVIVRFVVGTDGSISKQEVMRSVSPSLDAEALRVIGMMPKWKPGRQRGKAVAVSFTVPVTFKLKKPESAQPASINLNTGVFLPDDVTIFVDGIKTDRQTFASMDPHTIESIEVIKDKQQLSKHGVTGNGAIFIKTRKTQGEVMNLKVDSKTDAETVDAIKNHLRGKIQKVNLKQ